MTEECKHPDQVPIRVLGDERPHWDAVHSAKFYFWIGFCPNCRMEVLNRYSSVKLRDSRFTS